VKKGEKLKSFVGTPHFMAPDILDRSYTEKCDIWSIGVIVYMMFSQG
jgi:calcium-dependent protein kinase